MRVRIVEILRRLPFEYLRLAALVLLLQAFGLIDQEGANALIVFGLTLVLACLFAGFRATLPGSAELAGSAAASAAAEQPGRRPMPTPTWTWHVGFVVVASATLWLLLYGAERVSVAQLGEANFPVSNPIGIGVIVALAIAGSLSMSLASRRARQV